MKLRTKFKGFSLIELVVVMVIMGILASVMLANFRNGEKSKKVALATDTILDFIRTAQQKSLSGLSIPASNCIQGKQAKSYIVVFVAGGDTINLVGMDKCGIKYNLSSQKLPVQTQIKGGNSIALDAVLLNKLQIRYLTPFAQVDAADEAGVFGRFRKAIVVIQSSDGKFEKTINIDGSSGKAE
jgi:prepilin-type N-terminal cleavage/methylation domain-containing protein